MHPGVRGGIVEEHLPVRIADPSVGEKDIHHVSDIFPTFRCHQEAGRLGDHFRGILKRSHIHVKHITEPGCTSPDSVSEMEPAFRGLDGMGTFTVLALHDSMVAPAAQDLLIADDGALHAVHQRPAYSGAVSGIDETVLGTGVKGIFPIHELRMKHYVTLLVGRDDIRKPLPIDKVLRSGDSGAGNSGGEVIRTALVLSLHAEDPVDPAILMGGQPHVIDIRRGLSKLRHSDRTGPETEIIDSIGAFSHGEERLAIGALNSGHKNVFSIVFNCPRVHYRMDPKPFHKVGIGLLVEIVPPLNGSVSGGQNRVLISDEYTIPLNRDIFLAEKLLMRLLQPLQSLFVCHINTISSFSLNALKSPSFSNPFQGP